MLLTILKNLIINYTEYNLCLSYSRSEGRLNNTICKYLKTCKLSSYSLKCQYSKQHLTKISVTIKLLINTANAIKSLYDLSQVPILYNTLLNVKMSIF